MGSRRLDRLEPERQERLFECATDEFQANGYDGASLNRILAQSGMSKSSFYYYFDDKASLFTTLVERSIAYLFKEVGGLAPEELTAEDYWPKLEQICARVTDIANKNTWYLRLGRMFYRLRGDLKEGSPTRHTFQAARHWVGVLLARGQVLGVVRDDLPMSLLIDSVMGLGEAVDRWWVEHWDEFDSDRRSEIVAKLMQVFRQLLTPSAQASS
ncbi:MAG TPA: TetR/AcrR family transcriptional regulator [Fimbriimonadaceae bacterium]|nr:TetR/AcrR family transcriptional regulator [Fimbriimonadaceae bacterium]